MRPTQLMLGTLLAFGCGGTGLDSDRDLAMSVVEGGVIDLTTSSSVDGSARDLRVMVIQDMRVVPADADGVHCGTQTCAVGAQCCISFNDGGLGGGLAYACADSCGDGGVAQTCDGPEDCGGTNPYCCAEVRLAAGSIPDCPVTAASAQCTRSCESLLDYNCPTTERLRLCHVAADCADQSGTSCCHIEFNGDGVTACLPNWVTSLLSLQCF